MPDVVDQGILLRGADPVIEGRARTAGLPVTVSDTAGLPYQKTLIVEPGTRVPFDLLPAAWHYLERWDAAVPLARPGMLAAGVGTADERAVTLDVVGDLRVPLHACELLFVRAGGRGAELVTAWAQEPGDRRLAFLRALHWVKPRVCYLPATWLVAARGGPARTAGRRGQPVVPSRPLVRVEVSPGRFVKAHAGDEVRVLAHFRRTQSTRAK